MNAKLATAIKEIEAFAAAEKSETAKLDALFAKSTSAYYAAADPDATPEEKRTADEIERAIAAAVAHREELQALKKAKNIEAARIARELGDNDLADLYEISAI